MLITVEATYEGGVLRLCEPLPLAEHERVQVTVQTGKASIIVAPSDPSGSEPRASVPMARSLRLADEPIIPAEWEMLDLVLNVPPSPNARTVTARLGRRPLPDPPIIPTDDFE